MLFRSLLFLIVMRKAGAGKIMCVAKAEDKTPFIRIFSIVLAGYIILTSIVVPRAGIFPASLINEESFTGIFGFPFVLVPVLLILAAVILLWSYACDEVRISAYSSEAY